MADLDPYKGRSIPIFRRNILTMFVIISRKVLEVTLRNVKKTLIE